MLSYTIGEVDDVDGKNIQTRFIAIIGPLIPVGSMYVESQDVQRRGNRTTITTRGIPIKLNWKSVALGYLRVWLILMVFIYPFATHWGESVHFGWESPWLECIGFFALFLVAVIFLGKLSKEEKAKRRVLGLATGLKIHPRHLIGLTLEMRLDELARRVMALGIPTEEPRAFLAEAEKSHEDLVPAYAFAMYRAAKDPAWRGAAEAIWPKVAARGELARA